MALKACRECRRDVSTEAQSCPHCGVPNPAAAGRTTAAPDAKSRRYTTQPAVGPPKPSGGSSLFKLAIIVLLLGVAAAVAEKYAGLPTTSSSETVDLRVAAVAPGIYAGTL
jgi:hypothetical protein